MLGFCPEVLETPAWTFVHCIDGPNGEEFFINDGDADLKHGCLTGPFTEEQFREEFASRGFSHQEIETRVTAARSPLSAR